MGIKSLDLTRVGGHLDFVARQRTRDLESKISTNETRSDEVIFEERLTLEADGSVLHPNIFEFGLAGVFGLVQERFEDEVDGVRRDARSSGNVFEFDLDGQLFKNRNTPASLFAHRRRGIVPRPFLPSLETTTTSYGMTWQYVSEKTPTSLRFTHTDSELDPLYSGGEIESSGRQKNTQLRFETAYHFSDRARLSFVYDRHSVDEQPFDLRYDADEVTLGHHFEFGDRGRHNLRSDVFYLDQRGTIDIDRLRWREVLRLDHSDTLESRVEFEYQDRARGNRSPEVADIEERSFRVSGSVRHKMFDSQTLLLRAFARQQEFEPDLAITRWGGQAVLNYHKQNRWGVLRADYRFRAERNRNRGSEQAVEVIDETRTFQDPRPLTLGNRIVNVASITVRAEDRVTLYRRGPDYTVRVIGDRVEIERVATGRISDDETVLVDYQFTLGGDFELDTARHSFDIRQEFDFGLTPYYRFERQDQSLSPSGATGALAEDITAHTIGVEYRKSALSFFAEHEDHDSSVNPFQTSRVGASYTHSFDSGAQTSLHARWTDTRHRAPQDRRVRLWTLEGRYRHPITRNFSVEGAMVYRNGEDSASRDTDGVDLSLAMEWIVRSTEIRVSFERTEFEDDFTRNDGSALFVHVKRGF